MNISNQFSERFIIMGPCAMESLEQMKPVVELADKFNVTYIRAALFKPRTHPHSFQGLGESGLEILSKLKIINPNIKFVTEVCSVEHLNIVNGHVHMLQIGARNMQNFELLKDIGKNYQSGYVLLKRGFASTLREWLSSAQYLIEFGVPKEKVILCERGSRNSCSPTGVTLDFGIALKAKQMSGHKVIIDPSHGSKDSSLVLPLGKAAMALEFDGVMIECHPHPKESVSDAHQAISIEDMQIFLEGHSQWEMTPPLTISPTFSDFLT